MISETKMFSEQVLNDALWNKMLRGSSRSQKDADARKNVYQKVFSNYESMREVAKTFSGMAEIPLLSNQYFNATVASYVRSFAGFLTIERSMDQPTALLWYMDLLGVTDNRKVLPNLGPEDLHGINARFQTSAALDSSIPMYKIATNKKLIPGSVEIQLIHAADPANPIIIRDDAHGNLLAPAGVLVANSDNSLGVDYRTGVISFSIDYTNFVVATDDKYTVLGYEDVAGDPAFGQLTGPGNNRFKVGMQNIVCTSEPDMLVAENNLMAIAAMQKAVGANPAEVTGAKLTELYTKLVNGKLVKGLNDMWNGNAWQIDLDPTAMPGQNQYTDYNSYLEKFMGELVEVDTELAKRSYKGVRATAYVVGFNVANLFMKLKVNGNFVMNTDSTYINDLIGYYNGVPVMRHEDVGVNDGYAVCKTADGQLAPLMRGIFLPLTNTPVVGNYNNPSQFASGVYYQEVNQPIVPELMQKFTVTQNF